MMVVVLEKMSNQILHFTQPKSELFQNAADVGCVVANLIAYFVYG